MTRLINVTGGLLELRRGAGVFLEKLGSVGVRLTPLRGAPSWKRLEFESQTPLVPEPVLADSYTYEFLLRESQEAASRLIVVSSHVELVEHLLDMGGMAREAHRPSIDVRGLVQTIVSAPDDYRLAAVFARVDGFGQALRSVNFYGSDIGAASLFTDSLTLVDPHRVQLRLARSGVEVLGIGSRGELSFVFNERRTGVANVDAALRYLKRWIHW